MEPTLVALRPGEIFLKGKNRHKFERRLAQNVATTVRPLGAYRVVAAHGRCFVHGPVTDELVARLRTTFGVTSLSRATPAARDLAAISAIAVEEGKRAAAAGARSFAIDTRRPDKRFPLTSIEVNTKVGSDVNVATGMRVDLTNPDATIGIEIGEECFVYGDRIPGPGGLPVGTSGNAMLLLSGGIDSPVAGWLAQKRGLRLDALYFHAFPYVGDATRDKVSWLARKLARTQCGIRLWVVPFASIQEALRDAEHVPGKVLVLLYRRMMVRIAEAVARREGLEALVTGDNLGQVASQTLANMACIEAVAGLPLLRPLLTYDKLETIALARRIGTYDKSKEAHTDCCSLFVPEHPETRGDEGRLAALEADLPIADWVATAASRAELAIFDVEGRDVPAPEPRTLAPT
jgi:thiamine biosynthesis protein ThiI